MKIAEFLTHLVQVNNSRDIQAFRALVAEALLPSSMNRAVQPIQVLLRESKNMEVLGWHLDTHTLRSLVSLKPTEQTLKTQRSSVLKSADLNRVLTGCITGVVLRVQQEPELLENKLPLYVNFVTEMLRHATTDAHASVGLWSMLVEHEQWEQADKVLEDLGANRANSYPHALKTKMPSVPKSSRRAVGTMLLGYRELLDKGFCTPDPATHAPQLLSRVEKWMHHTKHKDMLTLVASMEPQVSPNGWNECLVLAKEWVIAQNKQELLSHVSIHDGMRPFKKI